MFTLYSFQFTYRLGPASVCPSKAFFDPLLALITYMCGRPTVSASPRETKCFTISQYYVYVFVYAFVGGCLGRSPKAYWITP